jgi:predicted GTPase
LDALIDSFPIKPEPTQEEIALPRFAVVGRPNAGKSSFINALMVRKDILLRISQVLLVILLTQSSTVLVSNLT